MSRAVVIGGSLAGMCCARVLSEHPPTDEAGFRGFLESLSSPALAEAVAMAEPLTAIHGNRSTANVFRRFERWQSPLRGFIAIGDSVCAFNPIYGQGMSTAAAAAGILRGLLRGRHRDAFEQAFMRRQAKFLDTPWRMAIGADFEWPGTTGERPPTPAAIRNYGQLLAEASHTDSTIARRISAVFHLTAPLGRIFSPSVVAKTLINATGRARRRTSIQTEGIPTWPPAPSSHRGLHAA